MKIIGDDLLQLMFLSSSDNRVVEITNILGWKQPTIDEKYYKEEEVSIIGEDNNRAMYNHKKFKNFDFCV